MGRCVLLTFVLLGAPGTAMSVGSDRELTRIPARFLSYMSPHRPATAPNDLGLMLCPGWFSPFMAGVRGFTQSLRLEGQRHRFPPAFEGSLNEVNKCIKAKNNSNDAG